MGRDAAAAENFARYGHEVYTIAEHRNPSLADISEKTGGLYFCIKDICQAKQVAEYVEFANPDMFYTNQDDALAAGVVDAVREKGRLMGRRQPLLIASPDRKSSRIEWDKFYLRDIIGEIDGSYNPKHFKVTDEAQLEEGMDMFISEDLPVAVKPRGLTGGKGVKVMGPHLSGHSQAREYAKKILNDEAQHGLLLEEVIKGHEFTLQGISDGKSFVVPPETYDYPYREDGDQGPGTGGMGSFTMPKGQRLPFLTDADYQQALSLMDAVQKRQKDKGDDFKGVSYGSFFKTRDGLKVTEFNARGGDPEMMNIINLFEDGVDLAEVLSEVARGELRPDSVRFKDLASAAIYLVSPDYAYEGNGEYGFTLDTDAVKRNGCKSYLVSAERDSSSGDFGTVGTSRTLAMVALGDTPWDARSKIHSAIEEGFSGQLEYRSDIASEEYIKDLAV